MKKSTITATFKADIKKVWEVVTNNNKYEWRSDLSKIDVSVDGNSFTEYTKDNFPTKFNITSKKPYERYEFVCRFVSKKTAITLYSRFKKRTGRINLELKILHIRVILPKLSK